MKAKVVIFSVLLTLTNFVHAEKSPKGEIARLITHSRFGNGDVYISLENNHPNCSYGYYISKDRAGYEGILSMLLSAYHAKTQITIYSIAGSMWPGSSGAVCEIDSVEY